LRGRRSGLSARRGRDVERLGDVAHDAPTADRAVRRLGRRGKRDVGKSNERHLRYRILTLSNSGVGS
jgi:hypothetical protein